MPEKVMDSQCLMLTALMNAYCAMLWIVMATVCVLFRVAVPREGVPMVQLPRFMVAGVRVCAFAARAAQANNETESKQRILRCTTHPPIFGSIFGRTEAYRIGGGELNFTTLSGVLRDKNW